MSNKTLTESPTIRDGGPVWPLAELHPEQGHWTAEDYLALTDSTNRLIEFTEGRLDFLPMPTEQHQAVLKYLFLALHTFVTQHQLGMVHFAALRIQIDDERFREPDLLFLKEEHFAVKRGNRFWTGADLVMEVVSPDNPERDWEQKRRDYAEAGIGEYWIVDPQQRRIAVLVLDGGAEYREDRDARPGQAATSRLIPGFSVDVAACFAAAERA